MRTRLLFLALILLSGCGAESVGTAATVAKLQADQARQSKKDLDTIKVRLEEANKTSEENLKRAGEAGGSSTETMRESKP